VEENMTARNKLHACLLVALVLALSLVPSAQQRQKVAQVATDPKTAALDQLMPIDAQVTVGTLSNGLQYFVRVNKLPLNRAELRLVVNAGSVLEDEDQRGLAHFVEHMAFNGTTHFAKNDLVKFMESIGMKMGPSVNAMTSFDQTIYMLQVPTDKPEVMEKAFLILEDWAHNLTFDPVEIDKERGVIVEEWRLGRGASARMQDKQFPILFKGSRYAERLAIGQKDVIETFKPERLKQFYADWYRPNLMSVIAVGDFDKAAIEMLVTQHFGALKNPAKPRPRPVYEVPDHKDALYAIASDKEATTTVVAVYDKLPVRDQSTVGAYRQQLVEQLYGNMLNYRLSDLAQKADAPFINAMTGRGRMVRSKEISIVQAIVKDGGVDKGLDAAFTEIERASRFGFTPTEFERQKRETLRSYESRFADREKQLSVMLASQYMSHVLVGAPVAGIAFDYALAQRFVPEVTIDEVNAVARRQATTASRVVMVSAPQKEGVPVPVEAQLAAVFTGLAAKKIDPYVDTLANATLMEGPPSVGGSIVKTTANEAFGVTQWNLSNGVKVVLKPNDYKADEILFRATSYGGTSLASDQDYIPASNAVAVIGSSGVGRFNAIGLRKVLAGKVVDVYPSISETEQGLSGSASPKDLETLFQLVYLTFTQPRADKEMFTVMTNQMRVALANRRATPGFAFTEALENTLSQNHLRYRPLTVEAVDQMNLDKSFAFYKDRFSDASGFTFTFVGNFDRAAMKPLVERYLGALPSTNKHETWKNVGMTFAKGVVKKTVEKGIEPKSQAAVVFTGPFQYDQGHRVVFRALIALMQTRMRDTVREQLGGTYSINVGSSYWKVPEQRYRLDIAWGCDPARVEELTKAVMKEVEDLRTNGPTEKQVNDVREQLLRDHETNIKQNSYLVTQILLRYRDDETDLNGLFGMPEAYRNLTPAVLQDAAKMYLNPENYVQVVLMPEKKTTTDGAPSAAGR
jgi:zinc protease